MKLIIGKCGICNTVDIGKQKNNFVSNDNYAEFTMLLSDDTIAVHGICKDCALSLTKKKVKDVFDRIKETWADEMPNWGAEEKAYKRMNKLKVISYGFGEDTSTFTEIVKKKKEKEDAI